MGVWGAECGGVGGLCMACKHGCWLTEQPLGAIKTAFAIHYVADAYRFCWLFVGRWVCLGLGGMSSGRGGGHARA